MAKVAMLFVLLPLMAFAQMQNQCIPDCVKGGVPPYYDGPPCTCTFEATLPGCTVTACKPGEDADNTYVCQCTPESHQVGCVALRCTNGTIAHSTAVSGPMAGWHANPSCNNFCKCGVQPPDCTEQSPSPLDLGAPACSCNLNAWPTGCTFKPCQEEDTQGNGGQYYCECTDEHHPDFCLRPQCKSPF